MSYRLLSYYRGSEVRAGVMLGSRVYDLAGVTGAAAHASLVQALGNQVQLSASLADLGDGLPEQDLVGDVSDVPLAAPLVYPGAVFCAAANFRDHMLAMARKLGIEPEPDPHELDVKPYHFLKPSRQTVVGPEAVVPLPAHAHKVDWEIELAAVIGRPAADVPVKRALEFVAGYTIGNDLSVRDAAYMRRPNVPVASLFKTDFLGMKGFDRSCPLGPWIVPASEITDPQSLTLKLWVGDELMQDSNTSHMIFSVAEQVSYLSRLMTLYPGDVVLTGTPAGTGAEQDRFLRPGEVLTAWIEGIGELRTRIGPSHG